MNQKHIFSSERNKKNTIIQALKSLFSEDKIFTNSKLYKQSKIINLQLLKYLQKEVKNYQKKQLLFMIF